MNLPVPQQDQTLQLPQQSDNAIDYNALEQASSHVAASAIHRTFGTVNRQEMFEKNMGWNGRELAGNALEALAGRPEISAKPEQDATFVVLATNMITEALPLAKPTKLDKPTHEVAQRAQELRKDIITQWVARLPGKDGTAPVTDEQLNATRDAYIRLIAMRDRGNASPDTREAYFVAQKAYALKAAQWLCANHSSNNLDFIEQLVNRLDSNFIKALGKMGLGHPENHQIAYQRLQAEIIAELALREADVRETERQRNRSQTLQSMQTRFNGMLKGLADL